AAIFDVPGGKVGQLHPHQRRDLIGAEAGDKVIGHGGQQPAVVGQKGGALDLFQHGVDHLHLVDAALDVAGGKGVALPREGEGRLAVQMVPPLDKVGGVVVAGAAHRGEGVVGVDVHPVQRVHNVDEAGKVDADILVH